MDGRKNQSKLTRTTSSLLRSSIHSLSSMRDIVFSSDDLEEQKPHGNPVRAGPSYFSPLVGIFILSGYTFFSFFLRDHTSASVNLLLALIFIAILLLLISRNKSSLNRSFNLCKQMCARKLGFMSGTQVQWFIGDSENIVKSIVAGEGVEFYDNGDFYEGEFHKGRCNGSGVYNFFGNCRYEGDWIDGKYDGYGIESWGRGSKYRGQYKQGLRHGYGVYRFYTGDSYAGEWCYGQSHGVGVQTCGDGSCFIGEFKCGVKHGLGCYHFRNGDRYAGEYFGDKIHGFGMYQFANGQYYQGSWHEGLKQGFGMYTFRNGETSYGEWDNGKLKNGFPRLNDAVQAAIKTATKAVHLRPVDERVNRAVAAANRAATAGRVAAVKAVQNRIAEEFC